MVRVRNTQQPPAADGILVPQTGISLHDKRHQIRALFAPEGQSVLSSKANKEVPSSRPQQHWAHRAVTGKEASPRQTQLRQGSRPLKHLL
jgi:hypothetical protein